MLEEESKSIQPLDSNSQSGIQTLQLSGDLESTIRNVEKYSKYLEQIRKLAVSVTNENDWVNENGTPYLQWSGANKIAMAFGVTFGSPTYEKEQLEDDQGVYINFICSGPVIWQNVTMYEIGSCSSRDKFFGMRTKTENGKSIKYYLPLSEVDLNNIQKKAHTNFMNRALKSRLGLTFSWEELNNYSNGKIKEEKCQGVTYTKGSRGGNTDSVDLKQKREKIRKWLIEINNGDEGGASLDLEDRTKWTNDSGKKIPGKRSTQELSEKQVHYLYPKIEIEFNELGERSQK